MAPSRQNPNRRGNLLPKGCQNLADVLLRKQAQSERRAIARRQSSSRTTEAFARWFALAEYLIRCGETLPDGSLALALNRRFLDTAASLTRREVTQVEQQISKHLAVALVMTRFAHAIRAA